MARVQLGDVVLGEGRTKVIVPITGTTSGELVDQAKALAGHNFDIVEWRVDYLDVALDPVAVVAVGREIVAALGGRPVLFTFRTQAEGGQQAITPAQFSELNIALINSGLVDAVDVEVHLDQEAGDAVIATAKQRGVAVVGSYHNFQATPSADHIVEMLVEMQHRQCDVAKAAVMPNSVSDVMKLMSATATMSATHRATPVLTMSMGGLGLLSRIGAQTVGSCATFAMVGRPSAPGQIPVEELQPVLDLINTNLPS